MCFPLFFCSSHVAGIKREGRRKRHARTQSKWIPIHRRIQKLRHRHTLLLLLLVLLLLVVWVLLLLLLWVCVWMLLMWWMLLLTTWRSSSCSVHRAAASRRRAHLLLGCSSVRIGRSWIWPRSAASIFDFTAFIHHVGSIVFLLYISF